MLNKVFTQLQNRDCSIGVVGLGYVGLPLACLLAEKFNVVGFDINKKRIQELKDGVCGFIGLASFSHHKIPTDG